MDAATVAAIAATEAAVAAMAASSAAAAMHVPMSTLPVGMGQQAMMMMSMMQPPSAFVEVEATIAGGSPDGESAAAAASKKNAWTPEEDAILTRVVAQEGAGHWTKVAAHLPHRMGRQCRERWFNHLAPDVKKGYWTAEEDRLILDAVREHGTKWSTIQKKLPGRSDNSIKNRYYSAIRKAQRLEKRSSSGAPLSAGGEGGMIGAPGGSGSGSEYENGALIASPLGDGATSSLMPGAAGGSVLPTGAEAAALGIGMRHNFCSGSAAGSPGGSPSGSKRKAASASVASLIEASSQAAMSAVVTSYASEATGSHNILPTAFASVEASDADADTACMTAIPAQAHVASVVYLPHTFAPAPASMPSNHLVPPMHPMLHPVPPPALVQPAHPLLQPVTSSSSSSQSPERAAAKAQAMEAMGYRTSP